MEPHGIIPLPADMVNYFEKMQTLYRAKIAGISISCHHCGELVTFDPYMNGLSHAQRCGACLYTYIFPRGEAGDPDVGCPLTPAQVEEIAEDPVYGCYRPTDLHYFIPIDDLVALAIYRK